MKANTSKSLAELDAAFYYDESSKSCLRFKRDVRTGRGSGRLLVRAGDEVGTMHKCGYWVTTYQRTHLKCHRIVYMLVHSVELGEDDKIDHEDGNRGNNAHGNLRKATDSVNSRNKAIRSDNPTGHTGVRFFVNSSGNTYVSAFWNNEEGKRKTAYFSTATYGIVPAFAMACERRAWEIAALNTEGAGYTNRHGK